MTSIRLRRVTKAFGDRTVIPPLDLEIGQGEFVVFVGPSGCGKSTLLRLIAGLEEISSGTIEIDGRDVSEAPPGERGLAMVFQSYALYPHMSVAENIGFPLKMAGVPKSVIAEKVAEAATRLNLTEFVDRRPSQLSGGQRQRVAIGRAIVRAPKAFLFDEPLSNLDAALRVGMRLEISELHRQLGTTMIYVTHDQVEAMTMADTIVVLNRGRIEQIGAPLEIYNNPANLFVAQFIGSPTMNILRGPAADALGAPLVGIRPEHLVIVPASGQSPADGLAGIASASEHLGSDTFIHVHLNEGGTVNARVSGEVRIDRGAAVVVVPERTQLHRFAADGEALRI
ncbi:ABC transporter ATP-binding protein [Methylobacterium mesophilicum SR1.6/6]|uniref:ABC transporter ATP-binding protein n=1 Tax=Methylobacterium mesophilicum SR1.6/6 TaxID=908290 RepID=A0A6B9G0H6_9HYPH|nr:ABC transporter ATP-binding protein [Methylobacterium mesophilicum]QGY05695.1 ABC transporter ATP-binding protein [Methylobacterium mesophilicum SR1.6/6]